MALDNPHLDATAISWKNAFFQADKKLTIPRYQRPYTWSKDKVDELWEDLHHSESLFIGTVMLNKQNIEKDQGRYEIIDGQQRYTTLLIFSAVLRDLAYELGRSLKHEELIKLASQIDDQAISEKIITASGVKKDYHLIPAPSSAKFLKKHIQDGIAPPVSSPALSTECKRLAENYEILTNLVTAKLDTREWLKAHKGLTDYFHKISSIRLILVTIANEYQAYEIFESVNIKGENLGASDLIKNKLLSYVNDNDAEEFWDEMVAKIDGCNSSMPEFLKYYWWSKYDYISEKRLYKEVVKVIGNKPDDWWDFLTDLVDHASIFTILLSGGENEFASYYPNHQQRIKVYNSIRALRAFGNKTWIVLGMSLFSNFQNIQMRIDKVISRLERYTFTYFEVLGLPGNWYHRKLTSLSQKIFLAGTQKAPTVRYEDMFNELWNEFETDKRPDKKTFVDNFSKLVMKSSSDGRIVVRYILNQVESFHGQSSSGFDESKTSIEHILPQKPSNWNQTSQKIRGVVQRIGNLSLISISGNSAAGNKSYSNKVPIYENERAQFFMLDELLNKSQGPNPSWNFSDIENSDFSAIEKRGKDLGEYAYKIWVELKNKA
jgi:hypothetical protein